ncbi:uncharacterized protein CLUP02_16365 [Colletotrichum lupini]|uniref:Uncharacterized protein n=1 Tax=Colletotrichum lupini TaxID=145971 RepID=A0A9Q8WP52_9PEZI|nr:uncharacterized protein CLUP02_16365 [Colletotrichum lupini]UQC90833.1 hypothetical protein CLUP02_16365 [Colletotrichum lupini]
MSVDLSAPRHDFSRCGCLQDMEFPCRMRVSPRSKTATRRRSRWSRSFWDGKKLSTAKCVESECRSGRIEQWQRVIGLPSDVGEGESVRDPWSGFRGVEPAAEYRQTGTSQTTQEIERAGDGREKNFWLGVLMLRALTQ